MSGQTDNKGNWYAVANLSKGQILEVKKLPCEPRRSKPTLKNVEPSGVDHYRERAAKLSYVLHQVAGCGFSNKAYKSFKRLNLVAFTATYKNFLGLVRQTIARLPTTSGETRFHPVCAKHKLAYPRFTRETTRVHLKQWTISVPLWEWKSSVKEEEPALSRW